MDEAGGASRDQQLGLQRRAVRHDLELQTLQLRRLPFADLQHRDVSGARTEVPELVGVAQPELLLVNDEDLTYAKVRLDERSLATVIARLGYQIRDYRITPDGACPACAAPVPGRWSRQFAGQAASRPFIPGSRSRLRLLHLS